MELQRWAEKHGDVVWHGDALSVVSEQVVPRSREVDKNLEGYLESE